MSKLRNLGAPVSRLPSRLAGQRDEHGHSRTAEPWRAWYSLARWKRLRWDVLVRDLFTCQCGCGRIALPPDLVADHIRPHRGDPALFWDPANLQTLHAACHAGPKQAAERRAAQVGGG